jgi:hypothetical protein
LYSIPHPFHPPWYDHSNSIWWSLQVVKLLIMQSSTVSCHFFPCRSKYSHHPVLKPSLSERDQISHPYKTYVKIMIMIILAHSRLISWFAVCSEYRKTRIVQCVIRAEF